MRDVKFLIPLFLAAAVLLAPGCSEDDDDPPPPLPQIYDINSSTDPKSAEGQSIEINGSAFLSTPGTVWFDDGVISPVSVFPAAAEWSDTAIVVAVPTDFTPPVTVTVTVQTANGTSNPINLDIVVVPSFGSSSSITWSDAVAPAMPTGLRGHCAAAVQSTASTAFLYVTGGQTSAGSAANQTEVLRLELMLTQTTVPNDTFETDTTWDTTTSVPASLPALPLSRSFHQMVVAHSSNSPVTQGTTHLYVIGGQEGATDTQGTTTVYSARITLSTGALGSWTVAGSLPQALWGHSAFVYRGAIVVSGGHDTSGDPVDTIYAAGILSDGSLGAFTSIGTLPAAIGSHGTFAFGGRFYITGGSAHATTDPNDGTDQTLDSRDNYMTTFSQGVLGSSWTSVTQFNQERKKFAQFNTFGTVLTIMGAEKGSSGGGLATDILTDGTFGSQNGTSEPTGYDAFNVAFALSPISPVGGGPRFIILGGDDFAGNAQADVWINTAP
jgi:hypothetical protein